MKRVLALLLMGMLLAPSAQAATGPIAYPPEIAGLLPKWIAAADAAGANDTQRPWFHEAEGFLKLAKEAAAQGRVRTTIFDLESYHELRVAGELIDKANASAPTVGQQKALIVNQLRVARSEANDSWDAFRHELHVDDAQIHSVRAAEFALYAADLALVAKVEGIPFDGLMTQFVGSPNIDRGYVLGLVHGGQTLLLDLGFARDILDKAGSQEGLPPRILDANWTALSKAVTDVDNIQSTSSTQDLESIAQPVRRNNEVLLSIAFSLAEQRAIRTSGIQQIYGDAKGRVGTVVNDLAKNMGKQLTNTSLTLPQQYGLLGVFTADAIDRAFLAKQLAESGQGDMGALISAWANLDHATAVVGVLGAASPVQPSPAAVTVTPTKATPNVELPILVALALVAAFVLRRR